jgi:hypothetical protein
MLIAESAESLPGVPLLKSCRWRKGFSIIVKPSPRNDDAREREGNPARVPLSRY